MTVRDTVVVQVMIVFMLVSPIAMRVWNSLVVQEVVQSSSKVMMVVIVRPSRAGAHKY